MGRIRSFLLGCAAFSLFLIVTVQAEPIDPEAIPRELDNWRSWVLHGMEDRFCPTPYNKPDTYLCTWPSRLALDLHRNGARFNQQWLIHVKTWVSLPGGFGLWPDEVKVDGQPALVMGRGEVPSVYLPPGAHRVEGLFSWDEMPEMIHVPPKSGLVALSIDGEPVQSPMMDRTGRLWLRQKEEARREEDWVQLRVYRLIKDAIPMQVTNLLRVNISGRAREIELEGALLEDSVPMGIKSPLPAILGKKGVIQIQGRPGRWEIVVLSRLEGPVSKLRAPMAEREQEIWAFQSQNHLRMVKIEGVSAIDPKQTDEPGEWQNHPTFILKPGSEMTFKEIRRGDPDPAPDQLHLQRTWWLDFDGRGFTLQDRINGAMSRQWYLAMNPPAVLGRASVDGVDQLITSQGSAGKPGVELRKGQLNLVAEARLEAPLRNLPAVGWDHDFESVSGVLNLPPGWRLITANGVDVLSGTWFERWSLLDLFVVLIIALAVWKLWSWPWGALALLTVGLTYHEPGAPRLVWLSLLAAFALLRLLPDGWVKKMVHLWRWISVVVLLVLAVPFVVQQARWGIYPQLEAPRISPGLLGMGAMAPQSTLMEAEQQVQMPAQRLRKRAAPSLSKVAKAKKESYQRDAVLTQDPNALIQTGPGLPSWRWRTIALNWNGPVTKDQRIRLWLLSPRVTSVLAFSRVALMALLICGLLGLREMKMKNVKFAGSAAMILIFTMVGSAKAQSSSLGCPPPELLKQLQQRLLEKPDCSPHCADIPRMQMTALPGQLRLLLSVHAAAETAIPLPGSSDGWEPEQVLVDYEPAAGLSRDQEGSLWVMLSKGTHTVTLIGNAPSVHSFQISLPLRPRRVTVESQGWTVRGVNQDGRVEASIQLTSLNVDEKTGPAKDEITIVPFFHIERVLSLGLDWRVITTMRRLTPPGTPAMIFVPLLEGESVTAAGIHVEKGTAHINMDPKMTEITWTSSLKKSTVIHLEAPTSVTWSESWTLDASPVWHCELSGIQVIHHQDGAGYWRPTWHPWPGERVTIRVTRPKAIPGQVVTIDEAKLDLTPGQRYEKASLGIRIRTSKGGQHQVTLPDGAALMSVAIDGKSQPIRQVKNDVTVPLQPGRQSIQLTWHGDASSSLITKAPLVGIGATAVNAHVSFQMPRKRWILWTSGPRLGPAVLFWTYLIVVILAALGLGRIAWTPLRTTHWLLLGLGLTQVHPVLAIVVVGWLLALGLRERRPMPDRTFHFNLSQLFLIALSVVALVGLYLSIKEGLLGIPHMQIHGNGSSNFLLRWTQDRIDATMPQPWVFSLPIWVFRVLMLFWALWLAFSLLKWLRWGWHCFSEGGVWRKMSWPRRKKSPVPPPPPKTREAEEEPATT